MIFRLHAILVLLAIANSLRLLAADLAISPPNQFVRRGDNAEFRAALSGSENAELQWRFNGDDLLGQTNSLLTLTNVQRSQEGAYAVVAKLSNNESLSATGALTVCWQVELTSIETNAVSRIGRDADGNQVTLTALKRDTSAGQVIDGFMLSRTDSASNVLWQTTYPSPQDLTISSWGAAPSSNGTTLLRLLAGSSNIVLVAFSPAGQISWEKRYKVEPNGLGVLYALALDPFGNIFLAGDLSPSAPTAVIKTNSFTFSKLSPNGDVLWVSRPGPGQTADGPTVLATDQSGNVVASSSERPDRWPDMYFANILTKEFDSEGNELWHATYRTGYLGGGPSRILIGPSGNSFFTILYTYEYETPSYTTQALEYSSKGELRILGSWYSRIYPNFPVVALDQQGNFYVCVYGAVPRPTLTFAKYDFDGNYLFTSVETFIEDLLPLARAWYSRLTDLRVRANQEIEAEGAYYPDETTSRVFTVHLAQNTAAGLPVIRAMPSARARPAGETIAFQSKVTGLDPLNYQWYFNGQPIALETNSTMLLIDAKTNQSGAYRLLVTNSLGCALSENAILKIVQTIPMVMRTVRQPFTVVTSSSTNAFFEIDISGGDSGRSYQIESSIDLFNWAPAKWLTGTPTNGAMRYTMYYDQKPLFFRTSTSLWYP